MKDDKNIVTQYFLENPSQMDGVKRATYAYHLGEADPGAHSFDKRGKCKWCGQTRDGVRWNWHDSPPECQKRPKYYGVDIEAVIRGEEIKFEKIFERAKKIVKDINVENLTGEKLAVLHHTHGIDPSMLEAALMFNGDKNGLPQRLHDDYEREYEKHILIGKRDKFPREILVVKTI